jgi:hypothetical protein
MLAHYGSAVGETGSFTSALTDPQVLMAALGVALGFGALKVGAQVTAAARAGSSATSAGGSAVRSVPQLLGPAQELPLSYFQLARSASYSMGAGEAGWRAVSYHVTAAGLVHNTAEARGTLSTIGQVARWDFGPLTQRPSVRP